MQQGQLERKKGQIVITGLKPWHVVVLIASGLSIIACWGFLIGLIAGR
jgi:hypothetical protein